MAVDEGLIGWVAEAMAPIGAVSVRKMMGGATLYCDGTVFAIQVDGELWFKSDRASAATWDAAGAERFTYAFKDGRTATMNYRRAPADSYDDPEALRGWAMLAIEAGRNAPVKAKKQRKD